MINNKQICVKFFPYVNMGKEILIHLHIMGIAKAVAIITVSLFCFVFFSLSLSHSRKTKKKKNCCLLYCKNIVTKTAIFWYLKKSYVRMSPFLSYGYITRSFQITIYFSVFSNYWFFPFWSKENENNSQMFGRKEA